MGSNVGKKIVAIETSKEIGGNFGEIFSVKNNYLDEELVTVPENKQDRLYNWIVK